MHGGRTFPADRPLSLRLGSTGFAHGWVRDTALRGGIACKHAEGPAGRSCLSDQRGREHPAGLHAWATGDGVVLRRRAVSARVMMWAARRGVFVFARTLDII